MPTLVSPGHRVEGNRPLIASKSVSYKQSSKEGELEAASLSESARNTSFPHGVLQKARISSLNLDSRLYNRNHNTHCKEPEKGWAKLSPARDQAYGRAHSVVPTFPHTNSCPPYYRVTGKTLSVVLGNTRSQRGQQFLTVPRTVICTLSVTLLCSISKPFAFLLNPEASLCFFLKQPRADFKGLFAEGYPQESGSSGYRSTFGRLFCGFCQQGRFAKAGVCCPCFSVSLLC